MVSEKPAIDCSSAAITLALNPILATDFTTTAIAAPRKSVAPKTAKNHILLSLGDFSAFTDFDVFN